MKETLRTLVLGTTPTELGLQFLALYAFTVLTIYQILFMRRDTAVVMSHPRVVAEAGLMSLLNLGVYHAMLWFLQPYSNLKVFALILLFGVWGGISNLILGAVDQDRSIRDTVKSTGSMFNCNWPLIRRCANHALLFLIVAAIWYLRPAK
ncbi:MAG TPA: hypothetical protein VMS86_10620 [Thermoanaerobaculia bacterium]|nr:hypothetical protein [Thermoanaerobaculia bacterium]